MEWHQITRSITDDLLSRGLKDPNIRLRSLNKIEEMLQNNLPEYIQNPKNFALIGKEKFKIELASIKGRDLNSAEKSIINEIYDRIQPTQFINCPVCLHQLVVPKGNENHKFITCLICGRSFKNPLLTQKSDKTLQTIAGGIILFLVIIFMIGECKSTGSDNTNDYSISSSDIDAYVMGKEYIRQVLISPHSADFPFSKSSGVFIHNSDNIWTIRGYVDSQNRFGAMLRTKYSIKLKYLGNDKWELLDRVLYEN